MSPRSPWVNHLLFADDCLIFISANSRSVQRLNEILDIYAACSGQAVNREKSAVFFSPNTPTTMRHDIKTLLGISVEAFSDRYLGLPTAVGRITSGTFEHIGERARSKIQGWSERLLACAGREMLLKSVIQSIPTYSMSCFRLTKKVCKTLSSCMARYWWSSSLDKRSMHWVSWETLATPKARGGMGFRELELFNIALLGKHGWRFITNPNSLCARVMKTKYFPDVDFMQATTPSSASPIWRAITAGREALKVGLVKRVGDGSTINIWSDSWIPEARSLKPQFKPTDTNLVMVTELIDQDSWTWRTDLVRSTFIAPDSEAILNIPLRNGGGEDQVAWNFENSGIYTVKSAYRSLVTQNEQRALQGGTTTGTSQTDERVWNSLWKLKVLPKIRVFWWRVTRGILPDECTLQRRHIKESSRCNVCLAMDEDLMHALIHCSHAQRFWEEAQSLFEFRLPRLHPNTWARDILCDDRFTDQVRAKIISVMWAIWHSRNRWTHDEETTDPVFSVRRIREDLAMLDLPRYHAKILPGYGWRPPDDGWVKVNCDGAINVSSGTGGAGGVARSSSALLAAWSKPLPGVTDPLVAESLSLREGVIFAHLRGFEHVIMETDCLEVVNLWNTRHNSRSVVAPILLEIGELVSFFTSFVIQHTYREANVPAHLCAKHSCSLQVTDSWLDSAPSFLVTSLMADDTRTVFVE